MRRPAFTLFELLLVLAIFIAVAAIVSPMASVMIDHQRLSHAADQVRTGLVQARLQAMRSGRPQVVLCTIGSGQLTVQPWIDPADAVEASDMAGMAPAGSMTTVMPVTSGGSGSTVTLVEGVVCESVMIDADTRAMPILNALSASAMIPVAGTEGTVATPILMYPDGTATDALVTIRGPAGAIQLRLRGLTGDVTRSEPQG